MRPSSALLAALVCAALTLALAACGEDGREPEERESAHPWSIGRNERSQVGEGRWLRRPVEEPPPEERDLERLEAIGYLRGSRLAEREGGVAVHRRDSAYAAPNLYVSGHAPEAVLMDMDGRTLHRWKRSFWEVWPDAAIPRSRLGTQWWRRVRLLENGDLIAIFEGQGIVRLDKDSRLIWANPIHAHHDLDVAPDGSLWVLAREAHVLPRIDRNEPVLEDFAVQLDPGGTELRRFSLLEAFERSPYAEWLADRPVRVGDVFHTNTLRRLDGRAQAVHPAFREGNLLISVLHLSAIAVVDPEARAVVWAHRGDYREQHDPRVLDGGRILLFDNVGAGERSRVLELQLPEMTLRWSYGGSEDQPLYSRYLGAVQPLPNGNVLITESEPGRALEVDRSGRIVWEFYNPHRAGERGELVATLAELVRLPPDFDVSWASAAPEARLERRH